MTHEEFKQLVCSALEKGIDIKLIADKLEVAPATILRWADGFVKPRVGIINSLAKELKSLFPKHIYIVWVNGLDYTAHNPQVQNNGELNYMDSAGVMHTAQPNEWDIEIKG